MRQLYRRFWPRPADPGRFCQAFTRGLAALAVPRRRMPPQAARRTSVVSKIKTRIAAGATILGLGGLTGLALSAGHQKASQPVATKPLIRTKVIRRTIHVTKHAKPKHPVGASPAAGAVPATSAYSGSAPATTGSSSVGASSYESAPVTTSTSGASAAGTSAGPVVTSASGGGGGGSAPVTTSASGGGGGEHDSEGGGGD